MLEHEAKAIINDMRAANERLAGELAESKKAHGEALDGARTYWNRIAELEARLAWRPVSEGLPTEHGHYLAFVVIDDLDDGDPRVVTYYPTKFGWNVPQNHNVTHWREIGPLPAAPNDGD